MIYIPKAPPAQLASSSRQPPASYDAGATADYLLTKLGHGCMDLVPYKPFPSFRHHVQDHQNGRCAAGASARMALRRQPSLMWQPTPRAWWVPG
mmetsp:Transcript_18342/g.41972  ORF Transcript_18342/g.41972 Transcript_18342/m.41972 type:complete len:94 (+) Transcript_18342:817-1098(+)